MIIIIYKFKITKIILLINFLNKKYEKVKAIIDILSFAISKIIFRTIIKFLTYFSF